MKGKKYFRSILIYSLLSVFLVFTFLELYIIKSEAKKDAPKIFGSTFMTMNNPYFIALNESIREVVKENADILITRDPAQSQERQNEQIEEMIDEGIQVLFANPVDWQKIQPALKACEEANVAVFVVDTDVKDISSIISVIQSDNYMAGRFIALDMMRRKPDGADIILLSHHDIYSTQLRKQGFLDAIGENKKYRIVSEADNTSEIEVANIEMNSIIRLGIKADVVFGNNDPSAIGALAAIEKNGLSTKDTLVYGVDGSPSGKLMVKRGYMTGTAAQYPILMGKEAANLAYKYLSGGKVPKKVAIKVSMITKENLDESKINEWQ